MLSIGSVAFLEKVSRRKARSWKITEWLLLILRCLLLVLLALLLAGPYWRRASGSAGKGWVLVGVVGEHGAVIDSLVKAGYERHELRNDSNWWEGFSKYDREAPMGVPFFVFTDDALRHFQGPRPVTDRQVFWRTSTIKNDTQWVARSWVVGKDSVGMITGVSGATATSYKYSQTVRRSVGGLDTAVLRVGIYADGPDGQWLTAAVQAFQQFTRRNISLVTGGNLSNADWIFWLKGRPLPDGLKAKNIFYYERGKEIPVDTWMRGVTGVQVEKVVRSQVAGLRPVWEDGFGRTLLGEWDSSGVRRYHFFSRLDPAWNGLVWSADFPGILGKLLLGEEAAGVDRRVIDQVQIVPGKGSVIGARRLSAAATFDLAPMGWILMFLVLIMERLLSFKKTK